MDNLDIIFKDSGFTLLQNSDGTYSIKSDVTGAVIARGVNYQYVLNVAKGIEYATKIDIESKYQSPLRESGYYVIKDADTPIENTIKL